MSRLLGALDELEARFGIARTAVHRTELGKDGRLVLHVEGEAGPRWFAHDRTELAELLPAHERELPGLTTLLATDAARVLAWRPGRRLVARVETAEGPRAVKCLRARQAEKARAAHVRAQRAAAGALHLPALLASAWPETLAFEWIGGAEELDFRAPSARFEALGRALARFQAAPTEDPDGVPPAHGRAEELAVLATWTGRYEALAGAALHGARDVAAELAARAGVAARPRVLAHRDLHDGQVLWRDAALVLLDFDLLAQAEPELDLANLAAHAHLCALQGVRGADPARAMEFERTLLAGYRSAGGAVEPEAWRFWTAATFLRLAHVHGLRPRSFHLRAPLVERAHRALHHDAPQA